MKRITVLVILTLCSLTTFAQAPGDTVTVDLRLPKSYGAGYSNFAIGASADFWKTVDERRRIFVGGRLGIDRERKEFLNSGLTLRGSFSVRLGLPFGKSWTVRPFIGAGISASQQRNQEYTKFGYNPKLELGVSGLDNTIFAYGIVFLPDRTENKVQGWGVGFDYFWPLSPRLSLHTGFTVTRFKFFQPTGQYVGWYNASGFTPTFGVTYHWATRVAPINRSQGYVTEFERQFLKENRK